MSKQKKQKTTLFILSCMPKSKKAKERKIFINGDYAAVIQMIEKISAEGSYAYTVATK